MKLAVAERSLGELLSQPEEQFRVPLYQRAYSWSSDQVDELWDDLVSAIDEEHFMGSVVLNCSQPGRPEVIDGQQRLATLAMVLATIRDNYDAAGSRLTGRPQSLLVADEWADSPDLRYRLRLGEANRDVFRDFVLRHPADDRRRSIDDISALPKSVAAENGELLSALKSIRDKVGDWLKAADDPTEALQRLEKRVTKQLKFVEIRVDNVDDAFLLFETLNDRGLQLSAADLLKSHLLSRYESENGADRLQEAASDWGYVLEALRGADITRFLRYYLLMHNAKVQKDRIFRLFKTRLNNTTASGMLEDLKLMAGYYGEFFVPEAIDHERARDVLEDLLDLRATTCYVALLPARHALRDQLDDWATFARLAEALLFRWTTIVGANAQELESIFQEAGAMFVDQGADGLRNATKRLLAEMPAKKQFIEAFAHKRMGTQYVARYMLRRIEEYLSDPGEWMIKPAAKVHIEHVMPQHLSEPWIGALGEAAKEKHGEYVQRWGNLTLLRDSLNREARDSSFDAKKKIYGDPDGPGSLIRLTQLLLKENRWTPIQLERRQRWLAHIAEQLWGSGFVLEGEEVDVPDYPFVDPAQAGQELLELIRNHESGTVELKSTARVNLKSERRDKKDPELEWAFGRAVTAMANSNGGTVVVGVADDLSVVGCEADAAATKGGLDGYKRWMTEYIKDRIDAVLATSTDIIDVTLDGKVVVRVDVPRAKKAVYLTSKTGPKRFFVRINNSTQELDGEDGDNYRRDHWGEP